jgi:hypothetical protein
MPKKGTIKTVSRNRTTGYIKRRQDIREDMRKAQNKVQEKQISRRI